MICCSWLKVINASWWWSWMVGHTLTMIFLIHKETHRKFYLYMLLLVLLILLLLLLLLLTCSNTKPPVVNTAVHISPPTQSVQSFTLEILISFKSLLSNVNQKKAWNLFVNSRPLPFFTCNSIKSQPVQLIKSRRKHKKKTQLNVRKCDLKYKKFLMQD